MNSASRIAVCSFWAGHLAHFGTPDLGVVWPALDVHSLVLGDSNVPLGRGNPPHQRALLRSNGPFPSIHSSNSREEACLGGQLAAGTGKST
eukprot:CAMPEP_0179136640 /NCGR_PEP_ID=MMETSP0796-20121207/65124_1 /TAXON_ID=73915 /ORGANISM="Pyrodinium bahamense, Strain pbaha01" /LENGTH=90 /DNA_ID=CAMNT_0020835737 /DNA_START=31 /DNA_END=299 /DNA_ORIENTATION=-